MGEAIVGFGHYDYRYASGHSGCWFLTGFASRKQNFALYIMSGFTGMEKQLERLARPKISRPCLYLRKLEDADRLVLEEIISRSLSVMRSRYAND